MARSSSFTSRSSRMRRFFSTRGRSANTPLGPTMTLCYLTFPTTTGGNVAQIGRCLGAPVGCPHTGAESNLSTRFDGLHKCDGVLQDRLPADLAWHHPIRRL